MLRLILMILIAVVLPACGKQDVPVVLHAETRVPERLSEWGVILSDGEYAEFNDEILPYELNTALFSDYALKLRSIWLPAGGQAIYDANDEFEFPVGTIVSKTFHYEKSPGWTPSNQEVLGIDREADPDEHGQINLDDYLLVETRLLVRYESGWRAFPYVWNAEQTEAWLEIAGDVKTLTLVAGDDKQSFVYVIPDANQCANCHAPDHSSAEIRPIGLKARHLNRDKQIEHWASSGVLREVSAKPPRAAMWSNAGDGSVDGRARAYLDINCAHCHNAAGAADTSGLHLNFDAPMDRNFGICKSPTAVGRGSGDRLYDIYPGRPDESILVYRMEHTDPAIAMPELGRSTVHVEAVQLMKEWIGSLPGGC
ncbi:MAG TPA: SO2930 family diheme c-type cytochrome [Woeseiaceae bacterium]|nr:SO2930 family diheme c-type cytochrome [Woeseiaceae bacterium]